MDIFDTDDDMGAKTMGMCSPERVALLERRIAALEAAASKFYWEWCEGSTEDEANAANELAALLPKGE